LHLSVRTQIRTAQPGSIRATWLGTIAAAYGLSSSPAAGLPTLQKFAGHKTIATTLKYTHANDAHVQASLDKLEARYAAGAETVVPSAATGGAKRA
jgi:integrase